MNTQTDNTTYRRVCITGVLKLETDLHLGTGEMGDYWLPAKGGKPAELSHYNCIALDAMGRPYIPGSTLRGLLRSLAETRLVGSVATGPSFAGQWFGQARGDGADHGDMGRARIYDAQLCGASEQFCMSRTAINAVTGTAEQHQLATHALVKAGAQFKVEVALDTRPVAGAALIEPDEVKALLALLECLTGAQLGGGKSVGQGVLCWLETVAVKTLTAQDFQNWLINSLKYGKTKKAKGKKQRPAKPVLNKLEPLAYQSVSFTASSVSASEWHSECFDLQPLGAILINNPHDAEVVKKQSPDTTPEDRKQLADLVFLKQNTAGKQWAIIPGSTLKGWFRAHCRRILMTLVQKQEEGAINTDSEKLVDSVLDELFGGVDTGASVVRFYDARAAITDADIHTQIFNAVDRFTGGVKDSALYRVRALRLKQSKTPAQKAKLFSGSVAYFKPAFDQPKNGWMNLLLLFAWRDAGEADLVLGWGKSRGFGRLQLIPADGGWDRWLAKLEREQLQRWEVQLHNKLGLNHMQEGLA